jgi:cobalamin synthase
LRRLAFLDRPARTAVRKFWKYTLVGVVVGLAAGGALYLLSGDVIVVLFVRAVIKVVDIVIGLVHLKSH